MSAPAVAVNELEFRSPSGDIVFSDLSFLVGRGELVHLEGGRGSGKTALSNVLTGFVPEIAPGSYSGEVSLDGRVVGQADARPRSFFGYVMQNPDYMFFRTSILDEVLVSFRRAEGSYDRVLSTVEQAFGQPLSALNVGKRPSQLSGGQKRLLAIICESAKRPRCLLMDGALAGLDARNKKFAFDIVSSLRTNGAAVLTLGPEESVDGWLPSAKYRLGSPGANNSTKVECGRLLEAARNSEPTSGDNVILRFEDVQFSYDRVKVLSELSVSIAEGQRVALIGSNGAGKTTIGRLVSGHNRPSKGTITRAPSARGGKQRTFLALQNPDLQFFSRSLEEEARRVTTRDDDIAVLREVFGDLAKSPWVLTPAQRQLFVCYLAAMSDSDIVLLDEPSSRVSRRDFWCFALFFRVRAPQAACVVISHDILAIAMICDDAVLLGEGRAEFAGPLAQLLTRYDLLDKAELYCPEYWVKVLGDGSLSLSARLAIMAEAFS